MNINIKLEFLTTQYPEMYMDVKSVIYISHIDPQNGEDIPLCYNFNNILVAFLNFK